MTTGEAAYCAECDSKGIEQIMVQDNDDGHLCPTCDAEWLMHDDHDQGFLDGQTAQTLETWASEPWAPPETFI
jgi:hypothetical protein